MLKYSFSKLAAVMSGINATNYRNISESAGFIMAGEIIDREKYGGLRPKPPLFPCHNHPE